MAREPRRLRHRHRVGVGVHAELAGERRRWLPAARHLPGRLRCQARGQQRPRLPRRARRQRAVQRRRDLLERRPRLDVPGELLHPHGAELRDRSPLHLGQEGRQELAGEPQAERGAGLPLPERVPRLARAGADRVRRGGRQLPAGQPQWAGQGRRPGDGRGPRRRRHEPRSARRLPLQQRELLHTAGRQAPGDADVPVQGRPAHAQLAVRQRRRRRFGRLPRVHARSVGPPRHLPERPAGAQPRRVRCDGRGLERLVRDGLPRGQRFGHRHRHGHDAGERPQLDREHGRARRGDGRQVDHGR